MEFLKPPTDNLYKFAFVGGLLLSGLSVYESSENHHSNQLAIDQYNKVYSHFLLGYRSLMTTATPIAAITAPLANHADWQLMDLTKSDAVSKLSDSLKSLEDVDKQLLELSVQRPPAVLRKLWLSPATREMSKKILGFDSDKDFEKFVSDQTDAQIVGYAVAFLKEIKPVQSQVAELKAISLSVAQTLRDRDESIFNLLILLAIGGFVAGLGLAAWFYRYQRFQDILIER